MDVNDAFFSALIFIEPCADVFWRCGRELVEHRSNLTSVCCTHADTSSEPDVLRGLVSNQFPSSLHRRSPKIFIHARVNVRTRRVRVRSLTRQLHCKVQNKPRVYPSIAPNYTDHTWMIIQIIQTSKLASCQSNRAQQQLINQMGKGSISSPAIRHPFLHQWNFGKTSSTGSREAQRDQRRRMLRRLHYYLTQQNGPHTSWDINTDFSQCPRSHRNCRWF